MQQWKKNFYLLWIAVFIAGICWSMVMPFMPVFLQDELGVTQGASAWAGVLAAVNSLGMAIMSPIWGAMGDRYGRKLMMLRAGVALSICYALMALVTGPYSLLGVRLLIGVLTGFIPTATALVGVTTPQEHVGWALALITTAQPTGAILGPLLGGMLADLFGIRITMAASAVFVGLITAMVIMFVKEQFTPVPSEGGNMLADLGAVLRLPTFAALLVSSVLAMAAMSTLDPVLVPYVKQIIGPGAPNSLAGLLVSLPGVAMVVMAPWWAGRARKWGFDRTLFTGLALGAGVVGLQAVAISVWDLGALRLAQGVVTASVSPGIAALIAQTLPQSLRGRAFGLNQSANSLGVVVGPLLGGFIGTWAGARWGFVATAVLFGLGAAWTSLVVAPRVRAGLKAAA